MSSNGTLTLKAIYGGTLAPINHVRAVLNKECDVDKVRDFAKAVEAARKIDGDTYERKSYWGELSIFSTRRLGELIRDGQEAGTIASRSNGRPKKTVTVTVLRLEDLGLDENKSRRAQRLADITEEQIRSYIDEQRQRQDDITKAGVVRFASSQSPKGKPTPWSLYDGLEAVNSSVRKILDKWPKDSIETLGSKLISMGEEIRDTGGLA